MSLGSSRLLFGANKYSAFHLLTARWVRHYAQQGRYQYVTLGGTELRDIVHLSFVDANFTGGSVSYEKTLERFKQATSTAATLNANGTSIEVRLGDLFDFQRTSDLPHLFFLDLEGMCLSCRQADFPVLFSRMFTRGTLGAGDSLFITSYLGRNIGWPRLFASFDAEMRLLEPANEAEKIVLFRQGHPSFTLFKALEDASLSGNVKAQCFGFIPYKDSSPMGLYGYSFTEGKTRFREFVRGTPTFLLLRRGA